MVALIISIDGPDFSGKSTIANLVVEFLRRENRDKEIIFKRTSVPSELVTGSFTKILRNSKDNITAEEYALAYALDHLHHYNNVIKPLEESDKKIVIILERSLLSTYIYQSIIGKTDIAWIREINKYCKTKPFITFVLRVNVNELINRMKLEKRGFDRFEVEQHVRKQCEVYYNLPEELRREFNMEYIDADNDPIEIAERIAERIKEIIKEFFG